MLGFRLVAPFGQVSGVYLAKGSMPLEAVFEVSKPLAQDTLSALQFLVQAMSPQLPALACTPSVRHLEFSPSRTVNPNRLIYRVPWSWCLRTVIEE